MLPPDYLAHCTDNAVKLYEKLNQNLTNDICRRIITTGIVTDSVDWQIKRLQASGGLYTDLVENVAKSTGATSAEIKRMFEKAGVEAYNYDVEPFRKAGLNVRNGLSPAMENVLRANMIRTNSTMNNLSMTTASNGQQLFVDTMDEAIMMVTSGGFSPDEALRYAVDKAGKEGAYVTYDSGAKLRLESAARMNLMTGVNQTAAQISMMNCKELETGYVETTAHAGARPTHEEWQGMVFKLEGSDDQYDNFYEVTEYGEVTGLCGANCKHSFHPFIPDISVPAYTQEMLDSYKDPEYKYRGKDLTQYEASQKLRRAEQGIRESKRRIASVKAAIEKAEGRQLLEELNRQLLHNREVYRQRSARWKELTEATGVKKDYLRTRIPGQSRTKVAQLPKV